MRAIVRCRPLEHGRIRSASRIWTRAPAHCLVLAACLAQLWVPSHRAHIDGVATHALNFQSDAVSGPAAARGACAVLPFLRPRPVLMTVMCPRHANRTIAPASRCCMPPPVSFHNQHRSPVLPRFWPRLSRRLLVSPRLKDPRPLLGSRARLQS